MWIQDIEKEDPEIVIKRFTSVVFGLTSSPFLLGATLNHHMRKYEDIKPKFIDQFLNDLYMDDNITGFDDLIIGFDYYLYVKTLMKEGGFIVRKWLSNCQELSKTIKAYEQEYFNEDSVEEYNKVLGISWTAENDMLSFDLAQILRESLKAEVITKKNVLKTVSSIYDPLGLLSPAVVSLKMLFQEVCTHKIAWDTPLPTNFVNKWIRTLERLVGFKPVSINRHYLCGNEVKNVLTFELHGFSDASMKACGAVVYLRAVLPDDVLCNIVAAKTKVAPISMKTLTVPRLELMGCLLLSKLFKSILQSLHMVYTISELFCWTDSYDCVHWINNKRKIRERFIQGRVEEIRRNLPDIKWLHCPGKLNPADLPSRGFVKGETIDTSLHGPMFLSRDRDTWPCVELINDGNDVEEVNESCLVHIVETKSQEGSKCDMKKLINTERYSSLQKLMRITCYVLKFIHKLKK